MEMQQTAVLRIDDLRDVFDAAQKVYELFADPSQWVQHQYNVRPMGGGGFRDPISYSNSNIAACMVRDQMNWHDAMNVEKVLPKAREMQEVFEKLEPTSEGERGFNEAQLNTIRKAFKRWIPKLQEIFVAVTPRDESKRPKEQYCSIGAVEFVFPTAVIPFRVAMAHFLSIEYVEYFNDNHSIGEIRQAMLDLAIYCRNAIEDYEQPIVVDLNKVKLERPAGNWHYCA